MTNDDLIALISLELRQMPNRVDWQGDMLNRRASIVRALAHAVSYFSSTDTPEFAGFCAALSLFTRLVAEGSKTDAERWRENVDWFKSKEEIKDGWTGRADERGIRS